MSWGIYSLLTFFVVSTSSAQQLRSSWEWKNPLTPNSNLNLYDVKYTSPATVWAVGANGTIIFSKDSGATWENRESPVTSALRKIQFINSRCGWILGDSGVVLVTKNYGRTWCQQERIKTNRTLWDICIIDEKRAWVCGDSSTALYTSDGGKSWLPPKGPFYNDHLNAYPYKFLSIDFTDSLHGWIGGGATAISSGSQFCILYTTNDGGETWDTLHIQQNHYVGIINTVKRLDNLVGAIYSGWGLNVTADGGSTWTYAPLNPGAMTLVKIIDTNNVVGYSVYGAGTVYLTTNRGLAWKSIPVYKLGNNFWNAIDFTEINTGIGVGNKGVIFTTADTANTWKPNVDIVDIASGTSFNSIFFVDNENGWMCGDGGKMFHTTDSGKSWTKQTIGATSGLYAVNFTSDSIGWTCGADGVFNTTNGGGLWSKVVPTIQGQAILGAARDIQFTNERDGTIIGSGDATGIRASVLRTTDRGQNWVIPTVTTQPNMSALYMIDSTSGWIVGIKGVIYSTKDGGDIWTLLPGAPVMTGTLCDVFFIDKNIGWVVGDSSYKTINGGANWIRMPLNRLLSVRFLNKDIGWAVGIAGQIFYTSNGGTTWIDEPRPPGCSSISLNCVFPLNAKDVFTVGSGGTILYSTHSGLPLPAAPPVIGEMGPLPQQVNFGGCCWIHADHDTAIDLTNIVSCGMLTIDSIKCSVDTVFHVIASPPYHLIGDSTIKVTLRYHPNSLGQQHVDTLLVWSDGYVSEQRVVLVGGAGVADVGDLPNIVDLGPRKINSTCDSVLNITNAGCANLVIDTIMLTQNKYYTLSRTQFTIPSHGTDTVTVHFTPTRSDSCPFLDTVVMKSNGLSPIRTVPLSGKINQGMLVGVPKSIKIHYSGSDTTVTIKLYNAECAAITMYDSLVFWNAFDISPTPDSLFTIQPGGSKNLKLRYMPDKHNTTYHDTLYLLTDGVDPVYTIPLEGSDTSTVGVVNTTNNPSSLFTMEQNHPNPFSQSSVISYQLPVGSKGMFEVRDMLGRTVYHTAVTSRSIQLTFDASGLPNGLYMYSLTSVGTSRSRMMMVVK